MRILHVIPSVAARDGGPAVVIREMTSALANTGLDVTVATTDADGNSARLSVPLDAPVRDGLVECRFFARSVPGAWKMSIGLARWLARNVRTFDVVHVHAVFSFATAAACRASRRAGVPYVIRPLGTLDPWSLRQKRWKKGLYYHVVERRHLRDAFAIHATSEAERQGVTALGFGAKVRVIALGVPVVDVGARERRPDAPVQLLFLSRLHPGKGVTLLLRAFREVLDAGASAVLTIAGAGAPGYAAELRSLAADLALGPDDVRFVGHVAGEVKRALLAQSDVFVLPSSHENFGIAVAEALAAGLPVVISDQVAIAPDVTAAEAGYVVPLDVQALCQALRAIVADEATRTTMGRRALTLARERYSWQHTADELRGLYAEMVGERRARV